MLHLQLFTSKILLLSFFFVLIFSLRFEFLFLLFFQSICRYPVRLPSKDRKFHLQFKLYNNKYALVNRLGCLVPQHSGTKYRRWGGIEGYIKASIIGKTSMSSSKTKLDCNAMLREVAKQIEDDLPPSYYHITKSMKFGANTKWAFAIVMFSTSGTHLYYITLLMY